VSRTPADRVAVRRARIARAVALGKAVGYGCFGLAVVLFGVGYVVGFTGLLSGVVVALLLVGCLVLPPAIVFGYGLRAAERAERAERAEAAGRGAEAHPADPSAGAGPLDA
jgi:hypothetical protein